jgi:hypothetical protein
MDCYALGVGDYDQAYQAGVSIFGWDVTTQQGIFAGFVDLALGNQYATALLAEEVDVMLLLGSAATGSSGVGAGEAVQSLEDGYLVGVDLDWAWAFPQFAEAALTSLEIHYENSLARAADALARGEFRGGVHPGDFASGEVGLSPLGGRDARVPQDLLEELADMAAAPGFACPQVTAMDDAHLPPAATLAPLPTVTPTPPVSTFEEEIARVAVGERIYIMNTVEEPRSEYPAGQAFYITHGWGDPELVLGPLEYILYLDGVKLAVTEVVTYFDGVSSWAVWLYNFPEGMTGTHIFRGTHTAECSVAHTVEGYEDYPCTSGEIVLTTDNTLTVDFVP